MSATSLPPAGVEVLDESTLLLGPLPTLLVAETDADVIKLGRLGGADQMHSHEPKFGQSGRNYAVLNLEKRFYADDFKDRAQRDRVLGLATRADTAVSSFGRGTVDRLRPRHEAMKAADPRVLCCSITRRPRPAPPRVIWSVGLSQPVSLTLTRQNRFPRLTSRPHRRPACRPR
jgi:crotonobetainyl-CoA:carnitine CoA-transferase CaiB-like acyl-CoA transferase